jgi:hypothetical protein
MARCDSCEALYVNGVRCHESGCPGAWREEVRECKWCGSDFEPEDAHQRFCDDSCYRSYHGLPDEENGVGDD